MSYKSAEEILPKELVEQIQKYVSGTSIYIPSKEKKDWGSQSKTKEYYQVRNQEIYTKFISGILVVELAEQYALTIKSIQRIIRKEGQNHE